MAFFFFGWNSFKQKNGAFHCETIEMNNTWNASSNIKIVHLQKKNIHTQWIKINIANNFNLILFWKDEYFIINYEGYMRVVW